MLGGLEWFSAVPIGSKLLLGVIQEFP